MGTSCAGHTDGASFQKEETSWDFSGRDSFIGPNYSFQPTADSSSPDSYERIEPSLLSDRGARPVAADDGRVLRQREEPFSNGGQDRLRVAAPEIRPADRAPKERVAREEPRN